MVEFKVNFKSRGKMKYTIKQTAEHFGISAPTLRYYEKEGLLDPVGKNQSGHRMYGEREFRRINFILTLRMAGVPVEDIRRYVALFHQGAETIPERKQMLEDQLSELRNEAKKLNEVIRRLEGIIDNYEETLMKRELTSRKEDPFYG